MLEIVVRSPRPERLRIAQSNARCTIGAGEQYLAVNIDAILNLVPAAILVKPKVRGRSIDLIGGGPNQRAWNGGSDRLQNLPVRVGKFDLALADEGKLQCGQSIRVSRIEWLR